ncbi:hypothetical protein GFC04_13895 [Klebsiella quasipneumoniae]|nr:hypothetical protein AM459_03115 [Klebsiella pneumoniae]NBZ46098.1 hypothetical protein [Klebsiella quasipneumoniae]
MRLCHPGRVPACLPGGAALTWATRSVARTRCAAPPPREAPVQGLAVATSILVCFSLLLMYQIQ